jgi:hypothetical protein
MDVMDGLIVPRHLKHRRHQNGWSTIEPFKFKKRQWAAFVKLSVLNENEQMDSADSLPEPGAGIE